jgi:hypothetical protein
MLFPPRVFQLLVTAKVVPSSLILFALIIEAIRSSETSFLTRATCMSHPRRRHFSQSPP